MRRMGCTVFQEVALTLAMAYLAYWVTAIPAKGSGKAPCLNCLAVKDVLAAAVSNLLSCLHTCCCYWLAT